MDSSPSLRPLPPNFRTTVDALHRVAEQIAAPARKPDNEIALAATPGGFGTPPFEHDGTEQQVRVEGLELVRRVGKEERRAPLESLAGAAEIVRDLLPNDVELDAAPLNVDAESSAALGDWYAFGATVLGTLTGEALPGEDPSPVRLWPEHFDIAIELGSEVEGRRANYGLSPGDSDHDEPYLYVGPWTAPVAGDLWQAQGFNGAEVGYADLAAADDPLAVALEFCRQRKEAL